MQVICRMQIHASMSSCSSLDLYVHRVIEIPFCPPVGIEISDGDWSCIVESLWFQDGQLYALTAADEELYKRPGSRPIDEIAAEYVADGWVLDKGGPEAKLNG